MEEYKENTKQGIKDKHEQEIPCKGLYIDCWTFIFNNGSFKPVLAKEPSIVKKKTPSKIPNSRNCRVVWFRAIWQKSIWAFILTDWGKCYHNWT